MTIEERLKELNIELPSLSAPPGNFVAYVQTGNLLYLAGAGPKANGKVGVEFSVEEAQGFAREIAIQHIAVIKSALGDLERVARIVKALGMINAGPEFEKHPAVMNGYSDCMVEVFGDKGLHARSAIGMASLPFGIPVEVEAIIEITAD
ncbi:MAG: RidA family protein [Gammaproteobacteria bacterium]|nr:RidA family protein [Gammaproteobacteria bacterium]